MVRLYAVDAAALSGRFDALLCLLDGERRARAASCGNTPAGRRSLAAGLLLSHVLGAENARGKLERGAHGKPAYRGCPPFNLSHAGDYAVLAVTDGAPVGVDIERCRAVDCYRLAERFFHADETAFLRAADDPYAAFFTLWTLKESYLKAEGVGFAAPPAMICILPSGENEAHILGESAYRFRRYDGAFDGYRMAVCSPDADFPAHITRCTF